MVAPLPPASESAILSAWRRDYRLSLVLVGVGAGLVVALVAFDLWSIATGNHPANFGIAVGLLGTAGFFLMVFGGTVAYYHRQGLRQS